MADEVVFVIKFLPVEDLECSTTPRVILIIMTVKPMTATITEIYA